MKKGKVTIGPEFNKLNDFLALNMKIFFIVKNHIPKNYSVKNVILVAY